MNSIKSGNLSSHFLLNNLRPLLKVFLLLALPQKKVLLEITWKNMELYQFHPFGM
jgi:hypothetical protein